MIPITIGEQVRTMIGSKEALRGLYPPAKERSLKKQLGHLDRHCLRFALMRSKLWDAASKVDRAVLPTLGQMLNDQTGTRAPVETQEQMVERYKADL